MSGILSGVKVLDLTQVVAGPLCTMLLADLGADVIKVEPPEGDSSRRLGDTFIGGQTDYFLSLNRNKRSLVVDLKTPGGLEMFNALVAQSDVVVENFRPGTMEKLGIGYEKLRVINSSIIYCSLSGFGPNSQNRDKPALDPIVQALSGIMQLTGTPETGPLKTGFPLADYVTPLFGAMGILAALYHQQATGAGQRVDISMLEASVFSMIPREGFFFATGKTPQALGNAHFQVSPANTYRTGDGRFLMVIAHNDKFWNSLVQAIGEDSPLTDERFETNSKRLAIRTDVDRILTDAFLKDTLAGWTARLERTGALFAPVKTLGEAFAEPDVQKMVVKMEHPSAGEISVLDNPIRLSGVPTTMRSPPPLLGQHTDEIRQELGF